MPDDRQERLDGQHARGQQDAAKGDYKPVYHSTVTLDILATPDLVEEDEAYDAGWNNANDQKS